MKKILLLCALCMAQAVSFAQDDFGLWTSFTGSHKFDKKWSVGVEAEYRACDNLKRSDEWNIGVDVDYKIQKHLKASAGYSFLYDNYPAKSNYRTDGTLKWTRPNDWIGRHRAFVSLTGDVDLGRFNLSLREKLQYTHRPESSVLRSYYTKEGELNYIDTDNPDVREAKDSYVLRSRLQVEYDIRNCPVLPFASVEFTNALNGFGLDKIRYIVGAEWKLTKQHSVSANYLYQHYKGDEDGDPDVNQHVICINYKVKF